MATVLELVKAACYETGITSVPSTLVNVTTATDLRLLHSFYATGRDLRQANCWPQLKRQHTIILQAGRNQYPLPNDFFAGVPDTSRDRQDGNPLYGPLSDNSFVYRQNGYGAGANNRAFRVFGPDFADSGNYGSGGQVMIDPVPGATSAGRLITFEYISRSWLAPPAWTPLTAYTSGTSYVRSNGRNYVSGTTASSDSYPPKVGFNGIAQDGGVYWMALYAPSWVNTTLYAPGDYVINTASNYLYVCTTGGTSAGAGGPSTTSDSPITDGTVTWSYCATSSWTGETAFAAGSFIKISAAYYKAVSLNNSLDSTQITGKVQPNHAIASATTIPRWTQSDGSVTWTYHNAPYEAVVSNSDICLFDDDLMILGIGYRFHRSTGAQYEALKDEYDRKKLKAVSRWNVGQTIDLANRPYCGPSFTLPEGGFGL